MLILGFDTSTPAVTVAVAAAGDTIAERCEVATNRHGERLAPLIDEVLHEGGIRPGDLTAIAVGLGPGPFTGLRVGIVTARSMADALGLPAYGECSLDVIAAAIAGGELGFAVMTDARRRQVYWARYDDAGRRVEGPDIGEPGEVARRLSGRVTQIGGAGALHYRDALGDFSVVDHAPHPSASVLAGLVAGRAETQAPSEPLTPLYLRRPDARVPAAPKQVTPA